jgi:hypothetical protein
MSPKELQDAIRVAGFPPEARNFVFKIVSSALSNYREYSVLRYRSHTGKLIKKAGRNHNVKLGRYDQAAARSILISALCRAWLQGMRQPPTLNHKNGPASSFEIFAHSVMATLGIGKVHQHLEEYWSHRKQTDQENQKILKNDAFLGGV